MEKFAITLDMFDERWGFLGTPGSGKTSPDGKAMRLSAIFDVAPAKARKVLA